MAGEIETAMRQAAAKVAQYVEDVSEMRVVTSYVEVAPGGDAGFDAAKPVARTVVKFDGDSETVVPVRPAEGGRLELDDALLGVHRDSVNAAIEYRARILNALLGALPTRGR